MLLSATARGTQQASRMLRSPETSGAALIANTAKASPTSSVTWTGAPSSNSAREAAIQLLSAVLGSAKVAALAVLALDGEDAVALVTVVLAVVVVLGVAVAGLGT